MPNTIIKFLLGKKESINHGQEETAADKENNKGGLFLALNDGKEDVSNNNAHLYYSNGAYKVNIAPSFVESQSNKEIVITFEE